MQAEGNSSHHNCLQMLRRVSTTVHMAGWGSTWSRLILQHYTYVTTDLCTCVCVHRELHTAVASATTKLGHSFALQSQQMKWWLYLPHRHCHTSILESNHSSGHNLLTILPAVSPESSQYQSVLLLLYH